MPRGFEVVSDTIEPFLVEMTVRGASKVTSGMRQGAREIEAYAQANAPWADITGQARAGLRADVFADGDEVTLTLAHSVDYGIWLETIQSGRYAIIIPTLERLGHRVANEAGQAIMRKGGIV